MKFTASKAEQDLILALRALIADVPAPIAVHNTDEDEENLPGEEPLTKNNKKGKKNNKVESSDDDPLAEGSDDEEESTGPTRQDIIALIKKIIQKTDRPAAVKLLKKFGADNIDELDEENYGPFQTAANKLIGK